VSLAWPGVRIKWVSEPTQARHAGLGRGEGARCPSACSRTRECRCREALCRGLEEDSLKERRWLSKEVPAVVEV
jgi:hypothetical protein